MRVALSISGQPRTWKRCYQTWFDAVSHLGEVDVFYHMWDYNTLPNSVASFTRSKLVDVKLAAEELEEIHDTLKPKKFQIESKRIFTPPKVQNPIAWWTSSQFYSLKKSAFIKRQYEIENNFEYDIVCRIRSDLLLDHKLPDAPLSPNTLYSCMNHHDPQYNTFRIGDVFYYANSYTYDQMATFFDGLDYIDATHVVQGDLCYPPELAFYYYMKTLGLKNSQTYVHCKIARTDVYKDIKGGLADYEAL